MVVYKLPIIDLINYHPLVYGLFHGTIKALHGIENRGTVPSMSYRKWGNVWLIYGYLNKRLTQYLDINN